jgi:hypothetical protein
MPISLPHAKLPFVSGRTLPSLPDALRIVDLAHAAFGMSTTVPDWDAPRRCKEAILKLIVTALALLVAALCVAGCKSLPGANGEYATHDHGQNNRGSP